MNVEQTAAWVRSLVHFYGWEEAEEYENNFRGNGIKGHMLQSLTLNSLKSDLGIWKYGHRLEIMMAIRNLFPSMRTHSSNVMNSQIDSPMVLTRAGFENVNSSMNTFYSPVTTFNTPESGPHSVCMGYSTTAGCQMKRRDSSSDSTFVLKVGNVGEREQVPNLESKNLSRERRLISVNNSFGLMSEQKELSSALNTYECNHTKELSTGAKRKSKRASPTNPIDYIALSEVQVRAGKSTGAKVVGKLIAGQIVVINQIKGQCGRIVELDLTGGYSIKGWVSLFKSDGRRLLVKNDAYLKKGQKILDGKLSAGTAITE